MVPPEPINIVCWGTAVYTLRNASSARAALFSGTLPLLINAVERSATSPLLYGIWTGVVIVWYAPLNVL